MCRSEQNPFATLATIRFGHGDRASPAVESQRIPLIVFGVGLTANEIETTAHAGAMWLQLGPGRGAMNQSIAGRGLAVPHMLAGGTEAHHLRIVGRRDHRLLGAACRTRNVDNLRALRRIGSAVAFVVLMRHGFPLRQPGEGPPNIGMAQEGE